MRPSSLLLCLLALTALPLSTPADKITITSTPPGAKVEIDGEEAGNTPLSKSFPRYYFHDPISSIFPHLNHPLLARLTLDGYLPKQIRLTEGEQEWISTNGRKKFVYYLIAKKQFDVKLERATDVFDGAVETPGGELSPTSARPSSDSSNPTPEFSPEELIERCKPGVVLLSGPNGHGSGFFVTETGVIATNAHVADGIGGETIEVSLANNRHLEGRVVYIDQKLDVAFVTVKGRNFPRLALADTFAVKQGDPVLVIGNPGLSLNFSATRGIVSAIGRIPDYGPGTWIQTDAAINPGNSGGPLLNSRGEVIGLATWKIVKTGVNGIGFALSAGDLRQILQRFYPATQTPTETLAVADHAETAAAKTSSEAVSSAAPTETGLLIFTQTAGEIWIDRKYVGNAPARLPLSAGTHKILLRVSGQDDILRDINILPGAEVNF